MAKIDIEARATEGPVMMMTMMMMMMTMMMMKMMMTMMMTMMMMMMKMMMSNGGSEGDGGMTGVWSWLEGGWPIKLMIVWNFEFILRQNMICSKQ